MSQIELADASGMPLTPLAIVRGQPIIQLPDDLYIPPEALEVFLESFEGPLDLLLYLIRKNSIDILDIPMAELTRQYMAYVEAMRAIKLELAAEYLVMAAVLIEIKARMLLPRPPAATEDEGLDPRAELMRRLLEYERIKLAARALDTLPRIYRDFVPASAEVLRDSTPKLPDVAAIDLRDAWYAVLARAKMNKHHRIHRDELSVREHMTTILRQLSSATFVEFIDLFDAEASVPLVVVHFIALLELVKEGLVELMQAENFAPLYVRLANAESPTVSPTPIDRSES